MAEADRWSAAIRSICATSGADFRKATWRERIGMWCYRKGQQMIRAWSIEAPIVKELVAIAEAAHLPAKAPTDGDRIWTTEVFPAKDGWKVAVFYDVDEFNYIERFVTPEGNVIDFWDWPDCPERQALIDWRPQ